MCVVDEIFIEVPSFQKTSPAFEKFLDARLLNLYCMALPATNIRKYIKTKLITSFLDILW